MDAQAIFFTNQKGDDQLIVATESFLNGTRRGITTFAQVQTTGEIAVHEVGIWQRLGWHYVALAHASAFECQQISQFQTISV